MEEKLYKVLNEEGESCNGGRAKWNLPTKGRRGEWMPEIEGELVECENGYHLCRARDVLRWIGPAIYEAEYEGEMREGIGKVVVRRCYLPRKCENWTEETARAFACWCVRNTPLANGRTVWSLLTDDRSKRAVVVAERYAKGDATREELESAHAAAAAAAADVAEAAAREDEAFAARAAARAAAWTGAWTSEWGGAGGAARAAAGAAARAGAWTSEWGAARAAARAAAWTSAETAAMDAQTERLMRILEYREEEKKK